MRNAARVQIYEEFSQRVGDIITGTVLQTTPDFTIIKIREGVEAELPHFDQRRHPEEMNERPAGERYMHNQRVKAIIIGVRDPNAAQPTVRGERQRPSIVVSRTHPDLLRRLFELEVPEVYDGVVEVRSVAREPGVRSKVAVSSNDDHLDPVGACVGPKGSRVRTVVSELLSLAIGKEGQNARLAARLTGMHIDIKNESMAAGIMREVPQAVSDDSLIDDEEAHRCEHVGDNGVQCRNMARPGSRFCGLHENLGDVEVSDDPDSLI